MTEWKTGRVRYWQYGQAEKSPDLAISDLSRFPPSTALSAVDAGYEVFVITGMENGTGPLLAIWASRKVA